MVEPARLRRATPPPLATRATTEQGAPIAVLRCVPSQRPLPPKRRGAGYEEWIKALQAAWQPDPVQFAGRFYRFVESEVNPKPAQAG